MIGVIVGTLAVGGVALGSTALKDNTSQTQQDSEEDSQQDTETEQESEQETEQYGELSREEIDQIVHDFLVSYQPAEQIEKFGFTFHLWEDPYAKTYFYTWCNDIPIVVVHAFYKDENGQTEGMGNEVFYYVDKSTGEMIEIQTPACITAPELEYLFYVGKTDIIIRESFWGEEPFTYYKESVSMDGFEESMISIEEAESLLGSGDYQEMEWSQIAALTANSSVDEAKIANFVRNYVPDSTYDVFELKDYPHVTKYYKEHIGVQYVQYQSTGKEGRTFGYLGTNFERRSKRNSDSRRNQIHVAGKSITTYLSLG